VTPVNLRHLGEPWLPASFSTGWRRFSKAHGFDGVTFHGLRHGAATLLLAAGVPDAVAITLMGHADTAILRRYQDVVSDLRRDAAARMDALLGSSWLRRPTSDEMRWMRERTSGRTPPKRTGYPLGRLRPDSMPREDSSVDPPETRYAKTADDFHIAYQVVGDGPVDFVYVGPWFTHLEYRWELPEYARYLRQIASFSRLILFDKRGFGLSDPVSPDPLPNLETRMDDIRAVMDEVGSDRAVIYGASESGMLDLLFAATYPERTLALVIHGSYPSAKWEPDAPEHELRGIPDRWRLYRVVDGTGPEMRSSKSS
jgi:Phage integrase family/alpha/beta hydrolase fold